MQKITIIRRGTFVLDLKGLNTFYQRDDGMGKGKIL